MSVGSADPEARPAADTPAVRQYWAAKRDHPDCLVLFRLGDFFELFGDDAELAAPLLGVTLTARAFGRTGRMPMCGVPHHSLGGHLAKLLSAGLRVAICDQVETPRPGQLVRRRVTRVLTAGTLIEDGLLAADATVRCVAAVAGNGSVGLAAIDVSTGACQLGTVPGDLSSPQLGYQLSALDTGELLLAAGSVLPPQLPSSVVVTFRPGLTFDPSRGAELLAAAEAPPAPAGELTELAAAGVAALVAYCDEAELSLDPSFLAVHWRLPRALMALDPAARRNLELTQSLGGGQPLLAILDRTLTPLGSRRLRGWILEPLSDLEAIHRRQEAVGQLADRGPLRASLRDRLRRCRDLERLAGRCVHGLASPRDLGAVGSTLSLLPELRSRLGEAEGELLGQVRADLEGPGEPLVELLRRALVEDPAALAREGGFIRPGFDEELDSIRQGAAGAREFISKLEERERERTGIRGLKVGYNRVFGYYIEVRNPSREQVPQEYVRRQTLVGAERYVTPELKEHESVVTTARERSLARELECLRQLTRAVVDQIRWLGRAGAALATLDALQGLAEVGVEQGWVMPEIDEGFELQLEQARHPLVEAALGAGRFVANDVAMDGEGERIWVLTGPNMAGKSTFLRQTALVCLMGQLGSMVPCSRARWGWVDRIFTRVGAQDEIAAGRSTFMVEMEEMALILDQASPRSLVILDEIGRGTSTYDGMSIAQALVEHLHDHPGMPRRIFFATHYHELTALANSLSGVRNYRVEVLETGEEGEPQVVFLHRIAPGGADRSYGINVAQLAGLPRGVLNRAGVVLAELEARRPLGSPGPTESQLPLPLEPIHPLVRELEQLELDGMTPIEALQKLADWQRRAGEGN